MKTAFILTACLVAFLFCLEVQGLKKRPRPSGRPRPSPINGTEEDSDDRPGPGKRFKDYKGVNKTGSSIPFFSDIYNWTIQVDENTTVAVVAGIRNGSDIVYLNSKSEGKRYKTAIIYDFTNERYIKIYSLRRPFLLCFLEYIVQTFDEIRNHVALLNNNIVEITNKVSKTANNDSLSKEEVAALKASNPSLPYLCPGPIYLLADASGDDQTPDTGNATAVFYDLNIIQSVIYPKPARGGRPFKGDNGGRGGRPGKGDNGGRGGRPGKGDNGGRGGRPGKGDNGGRGGKGPNRRGDD